MGNYHDQNMASSRPPWSLEDMNMKMGTPPLINVIITIIQEELSVDFYTLSQQHSTEIKRIVEVYDNEQLQLAIELETYEKERLQVEREKTKVEARPCELNSIKAQPTDLEAEWEEPIEEEEEVEPHLEATKRLKLEQA